jgi:hypothetical protein
MVSVFFGVRRWLADQGFGPDIQSTWAIERDFVDETNFRAGAPAGKFCESGWGEVKTMHFPQVLGRFPAPQQLGVPLSCFCSSFLWCSSHRANSCLIPRYCERRQLAPEMLGICYVVTIS